MQNAVLEDQLRALIHHLHESKGWFNEEELENTPKRIVRFLQEWEKTNDFNFTTFESPMCDELVILKDISFYSLCAHHMLPFYGKVHVAYLPGKRICGVSKLARSARQIASRPQVQEKLTQELADTIYEKTEARFVMVVVEGTHLCMLMRGVREHNTVMVTSAVRHGNANMPGAVDWKSLKDETLRLIR